MEKFISYSTVLVQFICAGYIVLSGPLLPLNNTMLLFLEAFGMALGLWAIGVMRIGHFHITPEVLKQATLVRRGPYRYIRHPMYTAVLLVTLAMAFAKPAPLRLLSWVVLLADLLLKLAHEEKLLRTHFPEYAAYQQETRRLIPFVY